MANFCSPMGQFRPKQIKSITERYHLAEVQKGLSLPDSPLRNHILMVNLTALNRLSIPKPTPCQLRQLGLEALSDYALPIPTEVYIPESDLEELKQIWHAKPVPQSKPRRKPSADELQAQIERLQRKLVKAQNSER